MSPARLLAALMLAASGCGRIATQTGTPAPAASVSPRPTPTPFLPAGFTGLPAAAQNGVTEGRGTPAPDGGAETSPEEQPSKPAVSLDLAAVLRTINQLREREGVAPLRTSPALERLAQARSVELSATSSLWHVQPDSGRTPGQGMIEAGFSGELAEHAVAVHLGSEDPVGVVLQALLTDPAHRRNLLAPQFSTTGLGLSDDGTWWYMVQLLAGGGPSEP